MIRYTCASCGASLETSDSRSGKRQTCPTCGTVNVVPLSEEDRVRQATEKKRQQQAAEKERELKAAEQRRQVLEAERVKRERQEAEDKVRPIAPSATEQALGFIGLICVVLGLLAGVLCMTSSAPGDYSGNWNYPLLAAGAIAIVAGILLGVQCFMAELVLRYLRRIMNAVERRK